jgi:hypothetical protein
MRSFIKRSHIARLTSRLVSVPTSARRAGYTYTRQAGLVRVKATPIPDVGAAGKKQKVIGRLKAKMLTAYRYHPVESIAARHRALRRAIAAETREAVVVRLDAISRTTRRHLPTASRVYRRDRNWVGGQL